MNDDAALLRRYAEGRDEGAFAELVQRHFALVYGAALRQLGGAAYRAEEVAQSVFTDLARKAGLLSQRSDIVGWLYTSTHFAAAKLKRTEQRRQKREQEAHTMHELLSGTSLEAEWDRLRPVLDDAMHELSERDRDVILQRFFQGRGFGEMGARLGLSEDAARMRVERALDELRALLARRQITSTASALALVLSNQPALAVPAGLVASVTGAALASTTAAGSVAIALQFMTTSKAMITVAAVALLAVSLGTVAQESRARQAAAEALTRTTADVAGLTSRFEELQRRTAAAESALQAERAELALAEQPAPKTIRPPRTVDAIEAGEEFLARYPEARGLWEDIVRANVATQLIAHYRVVNLTPGQKERLEDVVARTMAGAKTVSLPDGPVTLRREKVLTTAEMEAEARQAIGDDAFAQLMTSGKELSGGLDFTTQLASALYRTEPLSALQVEQMLQIFAAAGRASAGGSSRPNWEPLTVEAAKVLTPTQLAGLADVRRRDAAIVRSGSPGETKRAAAPTNP